MNAKILTYPLTVLSAISFSLTSGCMTAHSTFEDNTLRALDTATAPADRSQDTGATHKRGDARDAYYRYIRMAPENDTARDRAIARLADLEMQASYDLIAQSDGAYEDDKAYRKILQRTITLLETALEEFPDAEGNDRKLYQLAKHYDHLGEPEKTLTYLNQLVENHPSSPLYAEAQFRLAESAFSQGNYMSAELAYTAALFNTDNGDFHQRALFKRGWSRYRQSLFKPALEDFVSLIQDQDFPAYDTLSDDDQVLYQEYYRSTALTILNLASPETVATVFEQAGFSRGFDAYQAVSQALLQQERYSDAAVQWRHYIEHHGTGWQGIRARARIVSVWQTGGFRQRAHEATKALFLAYQQQLKTPSGPTTQANETQAAQTKAQQAVRRHLATAARYAHGRYQETRSPQDFEDARNWYESYLKHFNDQGQKDAIFLSYGDLLAEAEHKTEAFAQYERAAFDGNLIINPDAAYAAIALLSELTEHEDASDALLKKYLSYSRSFVQLYPEDERSADMALSASQRAFHHEHYHQAIKLAQLSLPSASTSQRNEAQLILVQSQLQSERYGQAETSATNLLEFSDLNLERRQQAKRLLALAIYRQGEASEREGNREAAVRHYRRVQHQVPGLALAGNGLYNAISLSMEAKQWQQAIALIEEFQSAFPEHEYRAHADRHLSKAYLNTDQTEAAARQFERLADREADEQAQKSSLWRAAKLYEQEGEIDRAINAYRRYAHRYTQPYAQNIEAMHKLTQLYAEVEAPDKRRFWEEKIVRSDRAQADEHKTDRTALISAQSALSLARTHEVAFNRTALTLPLDQSLNTKRTHMQQAIKLYATASSYGFAEISSQATHTIGRIYEKFAQSLLASERPKELNEQELIQYNILLEDRAFPFEDRAIEFYERNLTRVRAQGYSEWMAKSHARLETLFPVRYSRRPRASFYMSTTENTGDAE